jgi:hypothetical protein
VSLPPSTPAPTTKVELSGGTIELTRGLTWGEVQKIRGMQDGVDADAFAISLATGLPLDDCHEWCKVSLAGDVEKLMGAIFSMSRVGGAARFPN